ncbi:ATP synthase, H+ transporting, mitochondrial F1 complex, alpha subunit, isoform 1, isoform CRA_b [Mus musculus]|nr:ATP synthase, H+ transporting, mitochondrial F1 complex, alpha subunit, isoform 1, isoform CRA_b [Mus musculus]
MRVYGVILTNWSPARSMNKSSILCASLCGGGLRCVPGFVWWSEDSQPV